MKQKAIILFITISLPGNFLFSQESTTGNKKPRFCYVELKKMDRKVEKFILAGFSGDSILGFITKNTNKKIIDPEKIVAIKATDIKNIHLQIVKEVSFPDSLISLNDTFESIKNFDFILRKKEFGYAVTASITDDLFTVCFIPDFWNAGLFFMDLLFAPRGRSYYIRGNEKRFYKMVNDFKTNKETNDDDTNN